MKKVFKWINIVLSIGLVVVGLGVAYIAIPYFGNQALIVRSGSMSPAIDAGSVVVVRPRNEIANPQPNTQISTYGKGDIVAFRSEKNPNTVITHRIVSVEVEKNSVLYKTKGDANKSADGWVVNEKNILGKTFFTLPYLGLVLAFTKSKIGFWALIIIPAVIVIVFELVKIVKEIRRMRNSQTRIHLGGVHSSFAKASADKSATSEVSTSLTDLKVILPFFAFTTIFAYGGAFALPSDSEVSTGNTFTVAEEFPNNNPNPTPPEGIADHVVISEVQITGGVGNANNDFIELYNPTGSSVNLNGYKLVRKTSTATESPIFTFDSSHIVSAHGFFLWASTGSPGFASSIGADVFSSATIATSNNSIALKQITGDSEVIIDALSWSDVLGSFTEGTRFTPNLGANKSMERKALSTSTAITMDVGGADEFKGNGFDSNDNSTDFILRTASQPQNSASVTEAP